jgi:hypothetical protein
MQKAKRLEVLTTIPKDAKLLLNPIPKDAKSKKTGSANNYSIDGSYYPYWMN